VLSLHVAAACGRHRPWYALYSKKERENRDGVGVTKQLKTKTIKNDHKKSKSKGRKRVQIKSKQKKDCTASFFLPPAVCVT
jgi:hypothetical protein